MIGTDALNLVTQSTWRDFNALLRSINARHVINLAITPAFAIRKKHAYSKPRRPKAHQLQAGTVYACSNSASYDHSDDNSTANDSFCLQMKINHNQMKDQRVPKPTHLNTNLAYRLQPHHHVEIYI